MGPPKILLDLRPLQTGYADRGIGRHTRELTRKLLGRSLPLASLLFRDEANPFPEIPPLVVTPRRRRQWVWDQFILPYHLWRHKISLLHNFVALGPLDSIAIPFWNTRRCLITIHDLHMFHEGASPINRFYRQTRRIRLQMQSARRARFCTVDSLETQKDVLQYLRVPKQKVHWVPLGCDHLERWMPKSLLTPEDTAVSKTSLTSERAAAPQKKEPSKAALTSGQAALPKYPVILSTGDTPNKNLPLSYQIVQSLKQKHPGLTWRICGRPEAVKPQLPEMHSWIQVADALTDEALVRYYTSSTLLLFPSLEEGYGLPVVEAMACGCPVVTGNNEPMRTHLGKSTGLDPADNSPGGLERWVQACDILITQNEARERWIREGRQRANTMRWRHTADKITALYKEAGGL